MKKIAILFTIVILLITNNISANTDISPEETFKHIEKSENFGFYAEAVNAIGDWKVVVFPSFNEWDVAFKAESEFEAEKLIFTRPPMSPNKDKVFLIEAKITGKYGENFIIERPVYNNQAIATIPDTAYLKNETLSFGDRVYLFCCVYDTAEVGTNDGSSKTVSLVGVHRLFSFENFQEFLKYGVGHPDVFKKDKHIEIKQYY